MTNNKRKAIKKHAFHSQGSKVTKPYKPSTIKRKTSNLVSMVGQASFSSTLGRTPEDFPSTSTFQATF